MTTQNSIPNKTVNIRPNEKTKTRSIGAMEIIAGLGQLFPGQTFTLHRTPAGILANIPEEPYYLVFAINTGNATIRKGKERRQWLKKAFEEPTVALHLAEHPKQLKVSKEDKNKWQHLPKPEQDAKGSLTITPEICNVALQMLHKYAQSKSNWFSEAPSAQEATQDFIKLMNYATGKEQIMLN